MLRDPEWHIYIDAAMEESGSRIGVGMVIQDSQGRLLRWDMGIIPGPLTSNEAEYAALIWGLDRIRKLRRPWSPMPRLVIHMDNAVVVDQMKGMLAVRHSALRHWYLQARTAVRWFPHVVFLHISRTDNVLADALARVALKGGLDVRGR